MDADLVEHGLRRQIERVIEAFGTGDLKAALSLFHEHDRAGLFVDERTFAKARVIAVRAGGA